MGMKRTMLPVEEVDISSAEYQRETIKGEQYRLFVGVSELQMMQHTVIPEPPMYLPEFPPHEVEPAVVLISEDTKPSICVESALDCLLPYDPKSHWNKDSPDSFLYWTIRDYAYAYRSKDVTPSIVAEWVVSAVEYSDKKKPPMKLMISFIAEDVRKQAAASTKRFEEGNPLGILDGIFMAIKDDVDCYPHATTDGSKSSRKPEAVKEDAICVSRLRSCGVIFIGKANMPDLGLGVIGNNPNYGTTRNPHSVERYTGGSSSGPAAIVASGLCPAAIGTDGGGSIRIPSSLCGVVGLKTTFGRNDIKGTLCDATVEVVSPLAGTVEDIMLVYAAMNGSSPADRITLNPPTPCLPRLASHDSLEVLRSLRIGKYSEWFDDVYSTDISIKCNDALNLITTMYGCQLTEIVLPELLEMSNSLLVSMGGEFLSSLSPNLVSGNISELTCDPKIDLALFRSFTASEYVAAQQLRFLSPPNILSTLVCLEKSYDCNFVHRRRVMYYHLEAFKKVDVIATPTTGMTAPIIPTSSLKFGESNLQVSAYLMRFIAAGNLLGLPAISVPVGHDKQGLPIGLQLIGRPWGEATILRLAYAVEELCLKFRNRPSIFYDILGVI